MCDVIWGGSEKCGTSFRGGSEKCVTSFRGGQRFVTVCDRGGGSKIAKNSVTSFMDGPYAELHFQVNIFQVGRGQFFQILLRILKESRSVYN